MRPISSWICRKDWKLHGTATGGFFRCNIWQEDDEKHYSDSSHFSFESNQRRSPTETDGGDQAEAANDQGYGTAIHSSRVAWKQKQEMARFLHNYTRWEAHAESATLERKMGESVCVRLAPVVKAAFDFDGSSEFNFGGKGASKKIHGVFSRTKFPHDSVDIRIIFCTWRIHRAFGMPLGSTAQLCVFLLSLSHVLSRASVWPVEPEA